MSTTSEKSIVVDRPVGWVYDQWTQRIAWASEHRLTEAAGDDDDTVTDDDDDGADRAVSDTIRARPSGMTVRSEDGFTQHDRDTAQPVTVGSTRASSVGVDRASGGPRAMADGEVRTTDRTT